MEKVDKDKMTWHKIIDTNNKQAFEEKASKQNFVYVLYSTKPPYLPIDFAYSLYEITLRYNVTYKTLQQQLFRNCRSRYFDFIVKKVLTD